MSFNVFSLETDLDAEVKGVERDYKGAKVIVARANNEDYLKYVGDQYEKNRAAIEVGNKHSDEVAEHISKEGFCRHIIVGWSGFTDAKGVDFPYSKKNASILYDRIKDFVKDIRVMSAEDDQYRIETLKADAEALGK